MHLSIVIPTKNEARRLPATLVAIAAARDSRRERWEVIVADDGSRDDTLAAARATAARLGLPLVERAGAKGVGEAVRVGVAAASGARVLLCDADGPVPFECLPALEAALAGGFEVAAGSRRLGRVVVRQPPHRVLMGKVWGRLVRAILPTGVADTQCGFKLFRAEVGRRLFAASRSRSFAFHVEVLALAGVLGLRVAEVPVVWRDVPDSKIELGRESWAMARELVAVAWRLRRGRAEGLAAAVRAG